MNNEIVPDRVDEYDFHVAGASFAGSLISAQLLKYGSVLMLDRAMPGSFNNCGGGLPLDTFKSLDIDVPYCLAKDMLISLNGKEIIFPCEYVTVERPVMDGALFEKAISLGVGFKQASIRSFDSASSTMEVMSDGKIFKQSFHKLILAHGFNKQHIFPDGVSCATESSKYGLAYVEVIEGVSPFKEALYIEVDSSSMLGYCWLFPMPGGRMNIGVGSLESVKLAKCGLLEKFKKVHNLNNCRIISRGGGALPMAPARCVQNGNISLFGDAAGMVYPMNGEGLRYIARYAPIWAQAIAKDDNLNKLWRGSLTYKKFRLAEQALKVMKFSEHTFGISLYSWAGWLAAKSRKIVKLY